uniref:Bifunctional inhibitor/plant lipid transfer protein/seed storage helical domain-containing protein n=1 Tax=Setaria digitata TaxID=48799 RepID=A0A915PMI8_9BILA
MVATAAAAAAYGKLGGYQQQNLSQNQYTAATRQPQVHPKRSSSASQSHSGSNALRLQQRRMLERENIDQLLQKCRTNYRGIACSAQASPRYNDCGQHAVYHTLGGHPVPQLTLSDDGDTLCVRSGTTRGSLRMPSKQDHQVQAGPGNLAIEIYK